jgi:hypothetical protein
MSCIFGRQRLFVIESVTLNGEMPAKERSAAVTNLRSKDENPVVPILRTAHKAEGSDLGLFGASSRVSAGS